MQRFFLILFLTLLVVPTISFGQTPMASQQIGLCGEENVSSGIKGEVRSRLQTGGTDANTETCWPRACPPGMVDSTVISDKYKSGSADIFLYQRMCVVGIDSISLSECSSVISSEAQKCSPPVCGSGYSDIGVLTELRDKSGNFWTENVYRLCLKGSKIENATLVFKENYGNLSAPEQCPANFSDAGVFKQVHFNSSEYYRGWRICMKHGAESTTTTQINVTNATTTTSTMLTTTTTTLKATTTTMKPSTTSTAAAYPSTSPSTAFYPQTLPQTKAPCSDSDGGIAIHSAGSVRLENGTLLIDSCSADNLINEYYCYDGNVSIYTANCTAGCLNSACRGAGEALAEKGALLAGKVVDTIDYLIDLVSRGRILERGIDLLGKVLDTASSFIDLFGKLVGKGSQYVDTIEIVNKTANATNITTTTT